MTTSPSDATGPLEHAAPESVEPSGAEEDGFSDTKLLRSQIAGNDTLKAKNKHSNLQFNEAFH